MAELIVDIRAEETFDFDMKKTAAAVCEEALRQEKCPFEAQISLLITTPEEIRAINREYRDIDSETDVLSFPGVDFNSPADFSLAQEDPLSYTDPETGQLILGDIVLNAARVKQQAAEYGHSERREFAFLIAHVMLHLCGYDHMTPEEAQVMEERQEKVLQALGITREGADG